MYVYYLTYFILYTTYIYLSASRVIDLLTVLILDLLIPRTDNLNKEAYSKFSVTEISYIFSHELWLNCYLN